MNTLEFKRHNLDKIQEGKDAHLLLSDPIFQTAVQRVLDHHAEVEEKLVLDDNTDVRETTARIRMRAMMRRAVLDVVEELNNMVREADNAQLALDEHGD